MLKKSFFSLLLLCGLLFTFLMPVGLVQATVTNGNIGYYEEQSSSEQNSSSTSQSSDSSTSEQSSQQSSEESSDQSSDQAQLTDNAGPTEVASQTTTSKPEGNFLKTNDTVNYMLVLVGIVFTGIAVYNLKNN